jgi:hypothetical protein
MLRVTAVFFDTRRHDSSRPGAVHEPFERFPDGSRVLPRGGVQPTQFDQKRGAVGKNLEIHPDDTGRLPLTAAPRAHGAGGALRVTARGKPKLVARHVITPATGSYQ